MVGKQNRKKQAFAPLTRDDSSVSIDQEYLTRGWEEKSSVETQFVLDWLISLSSAVTKTDQVRLVQQNRKKLTTILAENDMNSPHLVFLVNVLLKLYLHPSYFALHIALDWVTNALKPCGSKDKALLTSQIEDIWADLCRSMNEAVNLLETPTTITLTSLHQWLPFFSAFGILERDLKISNNAGRISSSLLYSACSSMAAGMGHLIALSESNLVTTSAVALWDECAIEICRSLSYILKTNLQELMLIAREETLIAMLQKLVSLSITIVCSAFVSKDSLQASSSGFILCLVIIIKSHQNDVYEELVGVMAQLLSREGTQKESTALSLCSLSPSSIKSLSTLSKCAILRETITLFSSEIRLLSRYELLGGIHEYILTVCEDPASTTQLFGMQSLESWIIQIHKNSSGIDEALQDENVMQCLSKTLRKSLEVLCRSWSHPSRQINHIIPIIFEKFLAFLFSLSLEHRERLGLGSTAVIAEVLKMPGHHRGKYQAIKIMADILGADQLLISYPNLIQEHLEALKDRDVSAAVGTLLNSLLSRAQANESKSQSWKECILNALCTKDLSWRNNIADYLVPDLMKVPAFSPSNLLSALSTMQIDQEQSIFITVTILLIAKTEGYAVENIGIYYSVFEQAACAADDLIRFNALVASSMSLKSTLPVSVVEYSVLNNNLQYSIKTTESDHMMKIARAVKSLLQRCKDSFGKAKTKEGDVGVRLEDVTKWIFGIVEKNVYPGVTFDREVSSYHLVELLLSFVSPPDLSKNLDDKFIMLLLSGFLSNWDRSRSLAATLLAKMPCPWPGFRSSSALNDLLAWSLCMAESARLRESDAGAQLLSTIYSSYCLGLAWIVDVKCVAVTAENGGSSNAVAVALLFLHSLLSRVESNIQGLDELFDFLAAVDPSDERFGDIDNVAEDSNFPLAHGLLLTLRLCLSKSKIMFTSAPSDWQAMICSTKNIATKGLETAMKIVAEANSDVPFAPSATSKGPVNTATANYTMAASYVNTNTFTPVAEEGEIDQASAKSQRGIVAAWLLVKESSALLASLVDCSVGKSSEALLSVEEIQDIGYLLLKALGRLKHMGAIAETHVALETVCRILIRHTDSSLQLSKLPSKWMQQLLDRLQSQQQVFILRRSAGFAYSFLSILRAEPAQGPAVLLHHAMQNLLRIAQRGLGDEGKDWWKLSVHALNVLRIIILDSSFGVELDIYMSQAIMTAVRGFVSERWAIRNSSMMVFSASVQRSVSKEKNESANASSVMAVDFFTRYQDLLPFLEEQLEKSLGESNYGQYVLYPVLLLLAKFRAPLVPVNSVLEFRGVQGKIMQVLSHNDMLVRRVAAKAYTSLVAITDVPSLILPLLNSILSEKMKSANLLHGRIYLVYDLLSQIAKHRKLSYNQHQDMFLEISRALVDVQVLEALEELGKILCTKFCAPACYVYLQALSLLLELSGQIQAETLLMSTCKSMAKILCLGGEGIVPRMRQPYAPLLARLSLALLIPRSQEWSAFTFFWKSKVSDVRDGLSQGLYYLLSTKPELLNEGEDISDLLIELMKCIEMESEPASLDLHVQLLALLMKETQDKMLDSTFHRRVFGGICALLSENRNKDTIDFVLRSKRCCSGQLLEILSYSTKSLLQYLQASKEDSISAEDAERVRAWSQLVFQASEETQSVDLRLSAAKALEITSIFSAFFSVLKSDKALGSNQALLIEVVSSLVFVVLELLQDDDEEVREVANKVCCTFLREIYATESGLRSDGHLEQCIIAGLDTAVPATLVLMSTALAFVCSSVLVRDVQAGKELTRKLWQLLEQSMGRTDEVRVTLQQDSLTQLSKKIFEAEQPNLYKEAVKMGETLCRVFSSPLLSDQQINLILEVIEEDVPKHFVEVSEVLGIIRGRGAGSAGLITLSNSPETFRLLYLTTLLATVLTKQRGAISGCAGRLPRTLEAFGLQCAGVLTQSEMGYKLHPLLSQTMLTLCT